MSASSWLHYPAPGMVPLWNKSNDGLPTTVAVIGIPAGLGVQPWQLKELQEKGLFDFYEIMDGSLVIYLPTVKWRQTVSILLTLT